ncbi:HAMP domain-containing histidine kinase [Cytobacillus solani]|uniref:histidine kinase n=1 Tax=Cytobacillus solani TaxID=1637975 RepID=A0A0Q3QMX0_9BACI|nr:HAMP domain-containing sensor histidine kinase [Cytobacillus solani]KOP82464.1 histidine kinase [Bacillus sp. FJAT-21945]KQL19473.1 histidine kinase [Cytobacillus solani]USK52694.1 HAMP domain-containing histidine kinase [Cytobacillus solani]
MKSKNRLQRMLIITYSYFFIIIALIAAFSLFLLNEQILNYFADITHENDTVLSETVNTMDGQDNQNHEQDFYKMLLQTLLLFLSLLTIAVYIFGKWTASRLTTPLRSIADGIQDIARGQYNKRLKFKASYELAQIQDDFNTMAEKLERMKKEKQHLEENKQRMLVDLSHDLKTPITTIRGYIEAMELGLINEDDRRQRILRLISDKAELLSILIDDIFALSKLDSPQYPFNFQIDDIAEFTREIAAEYYEVFAEKKFIFQFDIPKGEINFPFNYTWLYRAISNILSNALKYNPPGTTVQLKLSTTVKGVKIYIQDDGVGIPLAIKDNIFDAFVRGDQSRKSDGGTGLGLAIAKQVIEKHGGNITLTSNGGTNFILFLPKHALASN